VVVAAHYGEQLFWVYRAGEYRDSIPAPIGTFSQSVTDLPLTEEEKTQIQLRLQALEIEHHDLDDVIDRLALEPGQDRLQLQRLKKRKLLLKDQISRLRTRLIPDIIA
jgi:hypothetical protein